MDRRNPWPATIAALIVACAIIAAYANHFGNGFHFDDSHVVVNNASIRSLHFLPRYFTDASTFSALPTNQSYRPIVSATLAFDYALGGGLKPFWFQLSTFIDFLVLAALLALLVLRLTASWPLAIFAAALYGLHPANADTINYVCARSDVISTLGVLAGFAIYLFLPRWRPSFLYLLPVAVGILAKPIAAVFAPLFVIYLLLFEERRGLLRNIFASFLVCGALSVFVWKMTPKTWIGGAMDKVGYLVTQPYVLFLYLKTFFWPTTLSADYDLGQLASAVDPRFWAGILFLVLFLVACVLSLVFRKTRVIGFGLAWFLIALLPTSLSPLAEVMNDHRIFFPFIGLVIALVGLTRLVPRPLSGSFGKVIATAAAIVLLCAAARATWQRNKVWSTDVSLWADTAAKSPNNGRALMNYGSALMSEGRLNDALNEFNAALKLTPNYPILFVNLAVLESAMGNQPLAETYFQRALQLGSGIPDCHTFYARWLAGQGRRVEAAAELRRALELSPADLNARQQLAALQSAPSALSASTPEEYLQLSLVQFRLGRYLDSIAAARQALTLRPDYAEAYNNIGASWNALARYDLAASSCQAALRLKPNFPLARNNLAYALKMASAPHH